MRKIPTLFARDPDDMRHVTRHVNPEAKWVLDGEGIATRKYDGTCVMLDEDGTWWARREVKPGKSFPPGYREEEADPNTGKTVGWEPIEQSPFVKPWQEALSATTVDPAPGTYELCGPKVNGNPERYPHHVLVSHARADWITSDVRDYDALRDLLTDPDWTAEGIVWHHEGGRMAKLKRRDFPPTA